ncbi:MAG: NfeD family protein [Candidatus Izimaplasma sp.]|nr:NfeD family protein [Candidatus Izimaplasma bacterium]
MDMELMIILWFVIIIVAALIEMNTMDLSSIWFSIGALIAFILSLVGLQPVAQIIVFVVVSVVLLVSLRPIAKNYFKTNVISTNSDRLVGKVAVCTKEIQVGDRGEVKIDGKFWLAVTSGDEDIQVNDKVQVLAIEGVKLIVDKIR